ncbi:MAG: LysM peptidoglycan-binding domain-containing protein [Spirosomaceae bacterium]|jgi:LysM repeat protein|nr:LysM peptidoglycan-binding domain-containing protein [Spirosomataceae bacterium]
MFEDRPPKNERPKDDSKSLPILVLGVLIAIICALFYIGWDLMSDDPSVAEDFTPNVADSVANKIPNEADPEENTNADTTSTATSSGSLPPLTLPKGDGKKTETATATTKPEETKPAEKAKTEPVEQPKVEIPAGSESYSYLVGDGETFNGIANRFNLKPQTLKSLNGNVDPNGIKVGVTKLKVPIQAIHTVGPGDILRVVAKKYGITVEALMAANKKTKNRADRGEKLIIPISDKL